MNGKIAMLVATLSLTVLAAACSSSSSSVPATTTTTVTAPMTLAAGCAQLTQIQTSDGGAAFGSKGFAFGAHPSAASAEAFGFAARYLAGLISSASWPITIRSDANSLVHSLHALATQLYAFDGSASMLSSIKAQAAALGRVGNVLEKSMSCASAY